MCEHGNGLILSGMELCSMRFTKYVTIAAAITLAATAAFAADSATIKGSVKFSGTAPKPEPIKMTEPVCEKQHAGGVNKEEVVINSDGTLKNVIVYVKDGLPAGKTFTAPTTAVSFDQKGCMYAPHVFGIQVGQEMKILNSDPTLHNIHFMGKANPQFNQGMTNEKAPPLSKKFTKAEMAHIKCDIHPWMSAWAGIFTHPFFSVSDDKGAFELKNLPAGEYTVAAWHEKYGEKTEKVKVGDGESKDVTFNFDGSTAAAKP